jgi:hypothetical protein
MNNEQPDGLDSLLDAALRDYSNRAPAAGFEQRIFGRIQSTHPMRRLPAWIGWVLIPVSLAAIIAAAISAGYDRPKAQPLPQVARIVQPPVQPLPPAPVRRVAKASKKRSKLPELETFPEPEPLTPGERALLRLARIEPEQARKLFADSAHMKDLTIDPLRIEALPY